MNSKKISLKAIAPVLNGFFIMSFCDLIGIGVDRAKLDFELSNTLTQLIPSAVFLWFLILSVSASIFVLVTSIAVILVVSLAQLKQQKTDTV